MGERSISQNPPLVPRSPSDPVDKVAPCGVVSRMRASPVCTLVLSGMMLVTIAAAADTPAPVVPTVSVVPVDSALGKKVASFRVDTFDVSTDPPKVTKFDSTQVKDVTAYIFVGTVCPTTNAYAERFQQTAATYQKKGVRFVYLYANREDTPEAQIEFHHLKNLGGVLVHDLSGAVAHQFGAARTTEIFLADKSGTVVFHGSVDDNRDAAAVKQHFFANALDEVLAGKPITIGSSPVFA